MSSIKTPVRNPSREKVDRDSCATINSWVTKGACGQHITTEVTSLTMSDTQVAIFYLIFEAHKSKIITSNLSVMLWSAKTTDFHCASRLPGKIMAIIGMISPEVFCYINYFVPWKIHLTYIFKEVCFSRKLTQPLHYYFLTFSNRPLMSLASMSASC